MGEKIDERLNYAKTEKLSFLACNAERFLNEERRRKAVANLIISHAAILFYYWNMVARPYE